MPKTQSNERRTFRAKLNPFKPRPEPEPGQDVTVALSPADTRKLFGAEGAVVKTDGVKRLRSPVSPLQEVRATAEAAIDTSRLKRLREAARLSIPDLADLAKVSAARLRRFEAGEAQPSTDERASIAAAISEQGGYAVGEVLWPEDDSTGESVKLDGVPSEIEPGPKPPLTQPFERARQRGRERDAERQAARAREILAEAEFREASRRIDAIERRLREEG
jgi:transcriptional regulator with XRE-family HTH domain